MKFTVEVEDFYLEEGELSEELKRCVKNYVLSNIQRSIKEKVEKQIEMEVKSIVEKMMYKTITSEIERVVKTGKTKSKKNSSEQVTLEEYVNECFFSGSNWQNFDDTIKKLSQSFSLELKQRYDLLFASQIVAKLNDNGLLKDEVARLVLEK